MNPTTVQNVVTYQTVIEFDNPDLKLFPGMTAYVSIPVAEAASVLKVPNGALRYRPSDATALLAKYGMNQGGGGGTTAGGASNTPGGGMRAGGGGSGAGQAGARRQGGSGATDPGGQQMPSAREVKSESATVWKLRPDGTLEPIRLRIGITDRTMTEIQAVLKGELKEGDKLVIGSSVANRTQAAAPGAARPGGPGR
jgi:HlyD family secretion protein